VGHIIVAFVLLPASIFFSVLSIPIVIPALIWLAVLGIRLWRPHAGLRRALVRTHVILGPIAVLLVVHGFHALDAARRSAEGGGGLLGAVGLIPIIMGFAEGALAVASLCISYSTVFKNINTGGPQQ
jgi:hypothetical protein